MSKTSGETESVGTSETSTATELVGQENPYNWTKSRRWFLTTIICLQNISVSMGASIFTPGIAVIAHRFNISAEITTLGVSLYVIGFSLGPIFFAPLSEVYGRRIVQVPCWILFVAFQFGCALAQNPETLLICRFFVGMFGSPAITVAGGVMLDIWNPNDCGPPLGLFTMVAFLGPVIGPIIGGYCVQMLPIAVGWRWCFWVQLIYSSVLGLAWFIIPETFHTTLIQRKAKRLHLEDNGDFFDDAPKARFRDAMFRPVQMLFQDPGVFLSSLYVSFLFGILYLFFAAYPIVFIGRYHMKPGTSSLAFLGIAAGVITSFFTSGYSSKLYNDLKAARGIGNAPFPEGRLPLAIGAAFLVPISLFWFGWSGNQRIHWIVPILSGLPFGWSMTTIFIGLVTFVAEGYPQCSASAIAANTILRSLFSATFPLFSRHMYEKMSPEWASTLLGFIAVVFVPVPYLFWKYGPAMREKSKFNQGVKEKEASVDGSEVV